MYPGVLQASKMESFAAIVSGLTSLTVVAKRHFLDVCEVLNNQCMGKTIKK